MSERQRPRASHWLAIGAVGVLVVAFSLVRIKMADIPWHLATGRLIVEDGIFPTTNTFSWTYPDHPLYQQYPLFQILLYGTWKAAGFEGLSVLSSFLWVGVLATWVKWGGGWRRAARLAPIWLVAVIGVQRHLLLRPEVLSLLFLGLMLLCVDGLRRESSWGWVGAGIGLQWMWANSHQLFGIGIGIQLAFLLHLLLSARWSRQIGTSAIDDGVEPRKPTLMLVGSLLASVVTPLGLRSILIPVQSVGTLLTQGASTGSAQSAELAPVWTDAIAAGVVLIALGIVAYAGARSRGRWLLFEIALLVLGLSLVMGALRGIGFFSLLTIGVASRWLSRGRETDATRRRFALGPVVVIASSALILSAWYTPSVGFLSVQPGVGRAVGEWPDDTVVYLAKGAPSDKLLNLGWAAANVLIWEGYDVFVDPRWESYPKEFLLQSIEAMNDEMTLMEQIDAWDPSMIVAEMRLPEVQERAAELIRDGEWGIVHADVLHVVLERGAPANAGLDVVGWDDGYPRLLAQEQIRVACWYERLGRKDDAVSLRAEAEASGVEISADLHRFSDCGG